LEIFNLLCYFISVHFIREHRKYYRGIMLSSFAYFIVRYNITALLSWHSEVYNVLWLLKLGNAIQRFMTLNAIVISLFYPYNCSLS